MTTSLLDNIYGSWFLPDPTFRALRSDPVLWQAALVVSGIQIIDGIRQGGGDPLVLVGSVINGWLAWMGLAGILSLLGFCLGRRPPLATILTLTGFAGVPWILVAPAQALPAPWGSLAGILAMLWCLMWQLWAVAVAFELPWWRMAGLVPLAFVAGGLALSWLVTGGAALLSLS